MTSSDPNKTKKLQCHCSSSSLGACHSTASKSLIKSTGSSPPFFYVLRRPSGDKVQFKERPDESKALLFFLLTSVKHEHASASCLYHMPHTHTKSGLSVPDQPLTQPETRHNAAPTCPLKSRSVSTHFPTSSLVGRAHRASHHVRTALDCREKDTRHLYARVDPLRAPDTRAVPPGRSLVRGWAAGARPDVSRDLHGPPLSTWGWTNCWMYLIRCAPCHITWGAAGRWGGWKRPSSRSEGPWMRRSTEVSMHLNKTSIWTLKMKILLSANRKRGQLAPSPGGGVWGDHEIMCLARRSYSPCFARIWTSYPVFRNWNKP